MWWLAVSLAWAEDPAPPRVHDAVRSIAPGVLAVDLPDGTDFPTDPARWTLTSADDTAYGDGRRPVALDVRTRAAELRTDTWPYTAVPEHQVLLRFDTPLSPGATYTLAGGAVSYTVPFDPDQDWTPSLQLNQVGSRPDAPGRWAYAGYWLAGLDPIELGPSERAFRVIDAATGATVHEGELALRLAWTEGSEDAYGSNYSQANVYELDLGAIDTPGDYYVVWDGVGRSWTFTVADDVWDAPFATAFRGLYHQRCGTALEAEYTDWTHGECHVAPVERTTADYHIVGEDAFDALPAAATGETIDGHGGWHDAADYDRNAGHLRVVDALLDLYEIDPAERGWDAAGIPESGNGIPDLLDEAAWGLWGFARLQGDDGGIVGGVGTIAYPALGEMPEDDDQPYYAYAEDPLSSYRFAGAAAKMARLLAPFDATAADDWASRAERAWDWAENNPRSYTTTEHRVYAAAELFKTTGDPAYDRVFKDEGPFAGGNLGWSLEDWDGDGWYPALWAYATSSGDAAYVEAAQRVITERADAWIAWGEGVGRRQVKHPYAPVVLGVATTPYEAGVLFRAYALTGESRYLEWATYSCDLSLGTGAAGWSWVTGLGDRPVMRPLQGPTLGDDLEDPVPGITVYGPSYQTSDGGSLGSVLAAYDPPVDEWPVVERYADVSYAPSINEFTVTESIAPTLFAFGNLAAWRFDDAGNGGGGGGDGDGNGDGNGDGERPPLGGDDEARACGCDAGAGAGGLWVALAALVGARRRRSPGRV